MKGVFKCAMEDDERRSWSVKSSSLGMRPEPKEIFKETQASKLGDAPMHPLLRQQSSVRPSSHYFYHFMCYVLCLERLALYFLFSFIKL